MRLPTAFDPIEPGEIDNFAFDFTADMGAATLVSTAWTCALASNQNPTLDPDPQLHILGAAIQSIIYVRDPVTGILETKTGYFSVGLVGGMEAAALGVTYVLEATVTLSDGRSLALNSTVLCATASI